MEAISELRERILELYSKYETYITPVVRFLIALVSILMINSGLGYMDRLTNIIIVIVVSLIAAFLRAVGKMIDVYELSKKHLAKNGDFLIYKAKLLDEEIVDFKKKYKNANFEMIPYELPLDENFTRSLLILK